MHKLYEEVLEAIWTVQERSEVATLEAVSARCPLEVNREQLGLMVRRGLLEGLDEPLVLTEEGQVMAESVVRRHRLAVTLFATILDMSPDRREAIACEVEHTLVPEVEEAICTLLGHPSHSPDGNLIPRGHCCSTNQLYAAAVIVNLTRLAPGERGRIAYIKPKHHERLHRLASFGLTPGTVVELHQRSPAYCIRFEGTELAVDRDVAEDIHVARIP